MADDSPKRFQHSLPSAPGAAFALRFDPLDLVFHCAVEPERLLTRGCAWLPVGRVGDMALVRLHASDDRANAELHWVRLAADPHTAAEHVAICVSLSPVPVSLTVLGVASTASLPTAHAVVFSDVIFRADGRSCALSAYVASGELDMRLVVASALAGRPVYPGARVPLHGSARWAGDWLRLEAVAAAEPAPADLALPVAIVRAPDSLDVRVAPAVAASPTASDAAALRAVLDAQIAGLEAAKSALLDFHLASAAPPSEAAGALAAVARAPRLLGALLHGASGVGKTALARAYAAATRQRFWLVSTPQLLSSEPGVAEARLTALMAEALADAPSLVCFDAADALFGVARSARSVAERRLGQHVLRLVDRLQARPGVRVVATCGDARALALRVRAGGRFEWPIEVLPPNATERLAIAARLLARAWEPTLGDMLAAGTAGFVCADVLALCQEAAAAAAAAPTGACASACASVAAVTCAAASGDDDERRIDENALRTALSRVRPSLLAGAPAPPRLLGVGRAPELIDCGGALARLRAALVLAHTQPHVYARLGIAPPAGVLLFGPTGTGKTAMARAVAREAGASCIELHASDVISKVVGESERRLAQIFTQARAVAPAIVLIDQLDALAPARDFGSGGGVRLARHEDRLLSTLLTLVDGAATRPSERVTLVCTTHALSAVDAAMLRPGRLDVHIATPRPTAAEAAAMLGACAAVMPIAAEPEDLARLGERLAERGATGADVVAVARNAALCALRADSAAQRITLGDLKAAMG